ncbi:MAG: 30S ribosomal protein S16 [Saprospiraceae bacterium]
MAVKIRLARRGRRKRPFYHIVIADARAPRDGKFIEQIGSYNPMTKPATIEIDRDKAFDWLEKGAQPTDTVRAILRFKGVMYKTHLQRGVKKGALTQEAADKLLSDWIEAKEAKVAERREETRKEIAEFRKMIDGVAKPRAAAPAAAEDAEVFRADTTPEVATEEVVETKVEEVVAAAVEEVKVEEAKVEETKVEEAKVEEAKVEEAKVEEVKEVKKEAATAKDDLTKIEGIGPKIAEHLNNAGILSFSNLAESSVEALQKVLDEAGPNYTVHNPGTWADQSKMAAEGKWEELKKWQDELDGGK